MMTDYTTMPLGRLETELHEALDSAHEGIRRACLILSEMHRRGHHHKLMQHPVLRHHEKVSSGMLTVKALLMFHRRPDVAGAVMRLPADQQDELAEGKAILLALHNSEGEIVEGKRTALSLDTASVDRVFGPDGIRSVEEQKALLMQERAPRRPLRN